MYMCLGCIDCDVCRWMCPSIYGRKGIKAAVVAQPVKEVSYIYVYVYICKNRVRDISIP
jgi:hypothetical protein